MDLMGLCFAAAVNKHSCFSHHCAQCAKKRKQKKPNFGGGIYYSYLCNLKIVSKKEITTVQMFGVGTIFYTFNEEHIKLIKWQRYV